MRPRLDLWYEFASTYSYQEPSLVFLAGTATRFTDGVGAAEFLRSGACHFALVDPRSERSFVQRADAVGLRYMLVQRIEEVVGPGPAGAGQRAHAGGGVRRAGGDR